MEPLKLQLPCIPSPLSSNLTSSDSNLAYVTNSPSPKIFILNIPSIQSNTLVTTTARYDLPTHIYHVNYVKWGGEWHLMIGTDNTIQAWNEDGSRLYAHFSRDDLNSPPAEVYFGASAATEDFIVVGSSVYTIHMIYRTSDQFNTSYDKIPTWECKHSGPVSVITASPNYIVSGDELGSIAIWKPEGPRQWQVKHKFNSIGINATSIGQLAPSHLVAVGFGQGMFRVYNVDSWFMLYQIGSHCKWLSGLVTRGPLVATCGEDSTVNIWNVTEDTALLASSKKIPNSLLVGIALIGQSAVTLSYDSDKLYVLSLA